jgi:hypothetical protein
MCSETKSNSFRYPASFEWTQHQSTENPSPRLWHTTVVLNNKWILYGGYNGATGLADVWSFDFGT